MQHTAILADPIAQKHDTGPDHPEQAARYTAVINRMEATGLSHDLCPVPVRRARDEDLLLVHTPEYVALVEREVAQHRAYLSTGDTSISPHSDEAARAAAGAAVSAVDAVFSGTVTNAFCVVRPPGHHASADCGMGFCLFNNVAIAARHAQRVFGAERVAIVDWDVHHGNGTQDIFYTDGSVLFFSTHQWPWYPGTGERSERGAGAGEGTTINCPFPAGSGRNEILGAFRDQFVPAVQNFRPDLILISAGFDSRVGDPLGLFTLRDYDFADLTVLITDLAANLCAGRVVSILEGGYNLDGLARACEAHVRALLGH